MPCSRRTLAARVLSRPPESRPTAFTPARAFAVDGLAHDGSTLLTHQQPELVPVLARPEERVPGRATPGGHIDQDHPVVGYHLQHGTAVQALHSLGRPDDRDRTIEADGIENFVSPGRERIS